MSILFGHPCGNPNSFNAALAHWEKGKLNALCIPWLPTPAQLNFLEKVPACENLARQLRRRCHPPLLEAPRIEGRSGEWSRMLRRAMMRSQFNNRKKSEEANQWLMRTMKNECHKSSVTSVHSYEDCSLWTFEEARKLDKPCIYDMPIGYYPAWQDMQKSLMYKYRDWLPRNCFRMKEYVPITRKTREMEMADIVLAPGSFVLKTIEQFLEKKIYIAPYGVDSVSWFPSHSNKSKGPLKFIFAGHISVRKGIPLLFHAWENADIPDAKLILAGSWQLAERKKMEIPDNVSFAGHCSPEKLLSYFQQSDVFVFPSYFEGFGMVITEAMASGLPVLASDATVAADILDDSCGMVFQRGNSEQLIEGLRYFSNNRDHLPAMKKAARQKAETLSWTKYRQKVSEAVESFC